jgi:Uma2 family endonuclease
MSAYAFEKTHLPKRNLPFPPIKTWHTRFDLPKTQKIDRPGWIPPEITDNWETSPYAYQTEEEMMPQGGAHGQLSSYLSELLRSYLEKKELMLLFDSFMLYRDQNNIKQRIGPDLLLMPLQKTAPSSYDFDIERLPPKCLVEITSPESHEKDLDQNLSLYARLGIKTYLVIDLMEPHLEKVREQIQLHLFRLVSGHLVEKTPDKKGFLTLPEMGLKIKAQGQQIILVDKLTGEVLLDVTELKEALESEVEKAKEAKRQIEQEKQRADIAEQQAKSAEQRAQIAFSDGEQKKALETARKMLAKGFDLADIAELTGLSIEELATLSKK